MNDKNLKVFIESTVHYFKEITGEEAKMGIPFLLERNEITLDYNASIGIAGVKRGGIYLTTTKGMLAEFIKIILNKEEADEESLMDMAGEMANTISGNVRKVFGSDFMISVPLVVSGKSVRIKLFASTYAIPINWRNHRAYLAIGIERS